MTGYASNHRDRVANPRSGFIAAGDGLPSTHQHRPAAPNREVTQDPGRRPPLPFAAIPHLRHIAGALGIALLSAVMAAVPSWMVTDNPPIGLAMGGLLLTVALIIAAPGLTGRGNPVEEQLRRDGWAETRRGSVTRRTGTTRPTDVERGAIRSDELERRRSSR